MKRKENSKEIISYYSVIIPHKDDSCQRIYDICICNKCGYRNIQEAGRPDGFCHSCGSLISLQKDEPMSVSLYGDINICKEKLSFDGEMHCPVCTYCFPIKFSLNNMAKAEDICSLRKLLSQEVRCPNCNQKFDYQLPISLSRVDKVENDDKDKGYYDYLVECLNRIMGKDEDCTPAKKNCLW